MLVPRVPRYRGSCELEWSKQHSMCQIWRSDWPPKAWGSEHSASVPPQFRLARPNPYPESVYYWNRMGWNTALSRSFAPVSFILHPTSSSLGWYTTDLCSRRLVIIRVISERDGLDRLISNSVSKPNWTFLVEARPTCWYASRFSDRPLSSREQLSGTVSVNQESTAFVVSQLYGCYIIALPEGSFCRALYGWSCLQLLLKVDSSCVPLLPRLSVCRAKPFLLLLSMAR